MPSTTVTRSAIGYIRVSTTEQVDSGLGLEAQRAAIIAEADRSGLTLTDWFADEGVSGGAGLDKRPGLALALDALKKGDVLIVSKRDRLARDAMLACWIEKEVTRSRATIVSAAGEGNGTDPTAQLMRRIIDAFAEFERAIIRARTKAALAVKRARGERVSRFAPYGYQQDGDRWVEEPHEQEAVALMRQWRGKLSLRDIAARLQRRGYLSRSGTRLGPETVRKALANGNGTT